MARRGGPPQNQERKSSLNIKFLGGIFLGHQGPGRRDIPDKNFMQVAFFCCFRQGLAGMSRDLGRDVPDLEKLYARKLWADVSFPTKKPKVHVLKPKGPREASQSRKPMNCRAVTVAVGVIFERRGKLLLTWAGGNFGGSLRDRFCESNCESRIAARRSGDYFRVRKKGSFGKGVF